MSAGVDALLPAFGRSAATFMQTAGRDKFTAPLFNVPGRLVVGGHCFVDHVPDVLEQIEQHCDASSLGQRMRGLGRRPNYVNMSALLFGYLNGREQVGLCAGTHPDQAIGPSSAARTRTVIDFWHRGMQAYLGTTDVLPECRQWRLLILDEPEVAQLAESLVEPLTPEARRLVAVGELFTFALNGEARVGVFHHGPYPLPDGSRLIVKELVGLRENEIGWNLPNDIGIDALLRIQRITVGEARVDLFGSLHLDDAAMAGVSGERLLAMVGGSIVELDGARIAMLTAELNAAMLSMYRESITWTALEQISYGWKLYAGLLDAFARRAGLDLRDEIRARFEATARRVSAGIESGAEPLHILPRLGGEPQPYTPLGQP